MMGSLLTKSNYHPNRNHAASSSFSSRGGCGTSGTTRYPERRLAGVARPTANGISTLTGLPSSWDAGRNVAWKTPVEGRGHSSPVVWGKLVFLTTDIEGEEIEGADAVKHKLGGEAFVHPDSVGANKKHTLKVLCFDAGTGKQLWDRVA